jgi:uncharacterized membrane protein SirB2
MDERVDNQIEEREIKIVGQIFGNSPTMLALCLTVIGLIKIYANLQRVRTLADNFLAFGVVCFLIATVVSYMALRDRTHKQRLKRARLADVTILVGLCCTTAIAIFITFSLAG